MDNFTCNYKQCPHNLQPENICNLTSCIATARELREFEKWYQESLSKDKNHDPVINEKTYQCLD